MATKIRHFDLTVFQMEIEEILENLTGRKYGARVQSLEHLDDDLFRCVLIFREKFAADPLEAREPASRDVLPHQDPSGVRKKAASFC
ncbi:MAG: hypothetical protein AB1640_11495 [bacterium]